MMIISFYAYIAYTAMRTARRPNYQACFAVFISKEITAR